MFLEMVENLQYNGSEHQSAHLGPREWGSGGSRSPCYHHTKNQMKSVTLGVSLMCLTRVL